MSLLTFYLNETPDHAGRFLHDIWAFSLEDLEYHHDFIQWLFPLDTPSPFNPEAPTLDTVTVRSFRGSRQHKQNLLHSLEVMLHFYGLADTNGVVIRADNFSERSTNWLRKGNHNHLRLTRILRTLHLVGLEQESAALLQCLNQIANDFPAAITPATLNFWQNTQS